MEEEVRSVDHSRYGAAIDPGSGTGRRARGWTGGTAGRPGVHRSGDLSRRNGTWDHILETRQDPVASAASAILIDLDGSIEDGAELAHRIRTSEPTASIPVVLLTTDPSISLKVAAARMGGHLVSASSEQGDLHTLGAALGRRSPAGSAA